MRPLQMLIAEDNEDDAFILTHALKSAGLPDPIFICRDGQEVIDYLSGNGLFADRAKYPFPGMLVLDIKMPRLTGLEVLHWVRAHPGCGVIPTIILSSSAHTKDVSFSKRRERLFPKAADARRDAGCCSAHS
jgi:CheY-like chemotaxis protein